MRRKSGVGFLWTAMLAALALALWPLSALADDAVATVVVSGGLFQFLAVPAVTFTPVTILDTTQTTNASQNVDLEDLRGTGAGWNLTISGTQFTSTVGNHTLASNAAKLSTPSAACLVAGTCTVPTNSVTGYPLTITSTAQKFFNAAVNTGTGSSRVTVPYTLDVPATAFTGTYTATWTFTLSSGP